MAKTPLKTSFLVASIMGFLISVLYVPRFSVTWSFTFAIVFVLMFIASMISLAQSVSVENI